MVSFDRYRKPETLYQKPASVTVRRSLETAVDASTPLSDAAPRSSFTGFRFPPHVILVAMRFAVTISMRGDYQVAFLTFFT